MITIKKYRGIEIKYSEEDGNLNFFFENKERKVKYLFEAKNIIDEPQWEVCDLKGYWVVGVFDDYIGTAIAERKDIKSGSPDWKLKGQYDTGHSSSGLGWRAEKEKVYVKTPELDKIFAEWEKQREIKLSEERKLKNIIGKLK